VHLGPGEAVMTESGTPQRSQETTEPTRLELRRQPGGTCPCV